MQFLIAKKTEGKDILKNAKSAAKTWSGVKLKGVAYIELALLCGIMKGWPKAAKISDEMLDELMEGLDELQLSKDSMDWEDEAEVYRVADTLTKVLAGSDPEADAEIAKPWGKEWPKYSGEKAPKGLPSAIGELRKLAQQAVKEKKSLYMLNDE